jgi:hypothetical protein
MALVRWQQVVGGVVVGAVLATAGLVAVRTWAGAPACEPSAEPSWTVARHWNEALLDAIRRDLPAPTVHARNLFHLSAGMWDAWAAFDAMAEGVFVDESHTARDVEAARNEAISYAAYRLLEHRYLDSIGASDTIPALDQLMAELCYPIDVVTAEGDAPAALGNRIAATIIAAGRTDGANEDDGYAPAAYEPVNPPLVVADAATPAMADPNRWQPLQLEFMISQNGIPLEHGIQEFVGPHWGHVVGFALPEDRGEGMPIDPGPPPQLGDPRTDEDFRDAVVEVIRFSSLLDPTQDEVIDVSPGAIGNAPLGTYDGAGHAVNPATGAPYEPYLVPRDEYVRALAVYWADGPRSETPPGHWNKLANDVSDVLAPDLRIGGDGPVVDRLEWDVKLYLALNGANHDAAIVAWGTKGHYDYVRPISMVRYMGGLGQSSDPDAPAHHPDGLPLVPGLIEVVTHDTTAAGGHHAHLAGHEGEVAVRSWIAPDDPEHERGRVGWIRAVEWTPYQLPTFVTPSFSAYVSGHSTFSRASAEVMGAFTGSGYAPGGLWSSPVPGELFEVEPPADPPIELQWATYNDAADQAGISRLYGGIHVRADDLSGRRLGAACGIGAWEHARRHYEGRARAGA